jgi:hypothetical protein
MRFAIGRISMLRAQQMWDGAREDNRVVDGRLAQEGQLQGRNE